MREVVHIDIANDPIANSDYKEDEDPTKFKSQKTGRGPLVGKDWKHNVKPVMTCYKLVTCEFKWFGLQTRVESFIQRAERRLFTNFHRQVFCWMDRWHGLTMEDIRAIEDSTKEELDKVRNFAFIYILYIYNVCFISVHDAKNQCEISNKERKRERIVQSHSNNL